VSGLIRLDDQAPAEAALGALADDEARNATLAAIGQACPPPQGWVRQDSVPFSSARKRSAASFAGHGSWVLGAPAQGLALKVISGDSPHTVGAVAARVGVPRSGDPVDARDLPEDRGALGALLEEHSVFGRVTPHQKESIALLVAALAAFVLLFPVPAVRNFYALELPHGAVGSTLLIAALGVAALTLFWVLSHRPGRESAELSRE
jgi:magnesium-transporting ATPase (P-type)